ncbi:MAG: FAD:protein FMN transferase, partial [Thermoguttaceae bacterium]|nr:FAD:protein FMN transferase [Thermoguttaceae bacterium]
MATQKQLENAAPTQSGGGSLFGTLIRFGVIAALLFWLVKPYLIKGQDASTPTIFNVAGRTMGTVWSAGVCADSARLAELNIDPETGDVVAKSCEELLKKIIQHELDKIDFATSTYKADSEISRFNRSELTEWFDVSPETAKIVEVALNAARQTGGAFDPTVAPLVNLYHFGPNKAPLTALPTDEEIAAAKEHAGWEKVEVRSEPTPGLRKSDARLALDLSGVAKGFAADLVASKFEELGLCDYMIEVGGEVRCGGSKKNFDFDADKLTSGPWTLGIEAPEIAMGDDYIPALYRKVMFDAGGALATSGDYHNYAQVGSKRISHIIDPRSGKPTATIDVDAPASE